MSAENASVKHRSTAGHQRSSRSRRLWPLLPWMDSLLVRPSGSSLVLPPSSLLASPSSFLASLLLRSRYACFNATPPEL